MEYHITVEIGDETPLTFAVYGDPDAEPLVVGDADDSDDIRAAVAGLGLTVSNTSVGGNALESGATAWDVLYG